MLTGICYSVFEHTSAHQNLQLELDTFYVYFTLHYIYPFAFFLLKFSECYLFFLVYSIICLLSLTVTGHKETHTHSLLFEVFVQ